MSFTQRDFVEMQQQLARLMKKSKDDSEEERDNFSSSASTDDERDYKRWAQKFGLPNSETRKAFLASLSQEQRDWLSNYNIHMKRANNLSLAGVKFFQEAQEALTTTKKVYLKKDEKKPDDEVHQALLLSRVTIVGVIMVSNFPFN